MDHATFLLANVAPSLAIASGVSKALDVPNVGHFVYTLNARLPGVDPEQDFAHVYVGVTSQLRDRLRSHARKWWWSALDLDLSEFLEFPTRRAAELAERDLIRSYQPAINRAGRLLVVA